MTDVPIWKQIRNYVEADPEHQRLSEAHRELREHIEERREAAYQLVRACADRLEAEYKEKHAGTCSG